MRRDAPRAVVDTNTLISGLFGTASPPAQLLDALLDKRFMLVVSPYLAAELLHVLTYTRIVRRLPISVEEATTVVTALLQQVELVAGELRLPGVTRDAKDDAIVACAVEGAVDYLVSGDRDLLVLQHVEGIPILTPKAFSALLGEKG